MKIRRGKLRDAKEILKLLNSTPELQGTEDEQTYTPDFVKGSIKNKDRELVLVAEENKKLIGFLTAELWKHKGYSFFVDLFVKPEFRNKGVASVLYLEYESILKKLKIKTLTALVLVTNKRMQKWCKKHKIVKGNKMYFYEKIIK